MKALIDFDGAPVFGIPVSDGVGGADVREGMLLEGPQGWGEFSPLPGTDDRTTARWLTAAIEGGTVGWPDPLRGRVPVSVPIPAVRPAAAYELTAQSGCATADVTVAERAGSLADDVARVSAVRDALGPNGSIRCHAHGNWDVDTAATAITALVKAAGDVDFVVQPCRRVEELTNLRGRIDTLIAADVSQSSAADVAVLRCGPLGGVRRALRLAEACGRPCVVASTMETSIGLAAGLALAGALVDLPYASALGTRLSLGGDVVSSARSLVPVDGHLPVAPMPAAPSAVLLERYELRDSARVAWWRERLRDASSAS